mmetsp:Transcript_122733/g.291907  ORF Transcript_122733/g.291907 Transcript_122733/m.291907 type:complete len:242 (-) Transcript_122733:520-1245(-)
MKPNDVLPHDVHVGWPESAKRLGSSAFHTAQVVDQRIEPHVHHMLLAVHWILRTFDAPIEGSPADGEVAHLDGLEPFEDLGPVLCRLDELTVVLYVLNDLLHIFAEAEEETRLGHLLQWNARAGVLVVPLLCLLIRDEALFADHVPTLVPVHVDVPILLAPLPHFSGDSLMPVCRGADIEIVRHVQALVQRSESNAVAVAHIDWLDALSLRHLRNLLPVFICTGHKKDILPQKAMVPSKNV